MAGNGLKWLEWLNIARIGWKRLERARNCCILFWIDHGLSRFSPCFQLWLHSLLAITARDCSPSWMSDCCNPSSSISISCKVQAVIQIVAAESTSEHRSVWHINSSVEHSVLVHIRRIRYKKEQRSKEVKSKVEQSRADVLEGAG